MTKERTKDCLWHGGKALLCAIQLWFLDILTEQRVAHFIDWLHLEFSLSKNMRHLLGLIHPVISAILFVALWRYYDGIDDRSFNRFCAASEPPRLLQEPAYRVGLALTALTVTPILTAAFHTHLLRLGLVRPLSFIASLLVSLGIATGFSVLRLQRLEYTWGIQKELRTTNTTPKLIIRIAYAALLFAALFLLIALGLGVLIPVWGSFFIGIVTLFLGPIAPAVVFVIALLCCIGLIRRLIDRRKFMKRLRRMRDKGELSFTVHGHPYLSVLFNRVFFGLTIVDTPHPDGKKRTDTTYTVGVISCRHRKGTIILCDHNVYRFMYAMTLRGIGGFQTGTRLLAGAQFVTIPAGAWYTNHSFEFPEGDGEKILLIDPAPRVLAIHGQRANELIPQDNASKLYGYTVYGKNSFVNMLERT